jgi:hypothetical protein
MDQGEGDVVKLEHPALQQPTMLEPVPPLPPLQQDSKEDVLR